MIVPKKASPEALASGLAVYMLAYERTEYLDSRRIRDESQTRIAL
jgi:hypothetical protein